MTEEILELTADVVISYASMYKLTPQELVEKIKEVCNVLSAMDFCGAPEIMALKKAPGEVVKKPPIPKRGTIFMVAKKKIPTKPVGKPAIDSAATAAPAFPKKELDKWLKAHKTWNHDDWLKLLDDLKAKGYGKLVGKKAGRDSIGLYLETKRGK